MSQLLNQCNPIHTTTHNYTFFSVSIAEMARINLIANSYLTFEKKVVPNWAAMLQYQANNTLRTLSCLC